MEDMFLVCDGVSMADSIYQLDTVDNSKTEVSESFNLKILPEKDRTVAFGASGKMKSRFLYGVSDDLHRALIDEHERLEGKKADWLKSKPDPDELNYEIATFNAAIDSAMDHSISTSRMVSCQTTQGKILLSKLLNDGIERGALTENDVVVVFACRKYPSQDVPGSAVSSSSSHASGPGGTKKRRNRIKRSRRKRKQRKSKYRK